MKKDRNTGTVRKVDGLGRIALPIELRRVLGIEIGDPMEYFINDADGRLTLRRYRTQECMFCLSTEDLSYFKEYFICAPCLEHVPGNEKVSEGAAVSDQDSPELKIGNTPKRRRTNSKETADNLTKIMEQHPDASQKVWAGLLGISQARVSQLAKNQKNSKSNETVSKGAKVMEQHPDASQKNEADLLDISETPVSQLTKRKTGKSKETADRLSKVMEQHPHASQKKWADLLGISQGRVSQLLQQLTESSHQSP